MRHQTKLVSLFNHCLVDKHNRHVVVYGVDSLARGAFQPARVRLHLDFDLARGAGEYLKQLLAYRHLLQSSYLRVVKSNTRFGERQFSLFP